METVARLTANNKLTIPVCIRKYLGMERGGKVKLKVIEKKGVRQMFVDVTHLCERNSEIV